MHYPPINKALFIKNRVKIISELDKNAIAIINSADEMPRNADNFYPYRQNSDFFYLTGIEQEKSILLLCPNLSQEEMSEILFIIKPNELLETWTGHRLTKEEATQISGIANVLYIDEFEGVSKKLLPSFKTVYLNNRAYPKLGEVELKEFRFAKMLQEKYPYVHYKGLIEILTACRLQKEPEEIELIKKSAHIGEQALQHAVKHVKDGVKEYELEAALLYKFLQQGASGCSFMPIVASGGNALTLHYVKNSGICRNDDLLLLDFGCEYANYASDCSVTLPVSGTFSPRQKECYEAVFDVFEKAKQLFIIGNTIAHINREVNIFLEQKMIELGLFTHEDVLRQNEEEPLFKKYYMHGVSHFIGLDAHDAGDASVTFKSGMVVSCEPGLYLKEENIGIRIETMLLITDKEPIDLLPNTPRTVEEIETFMKRI